jgi:predicted nuclease of predicted toxin-antitoxin system
VDVLTVPEAGTLGVSDAEQLQRARDEERVIFTQDDDFLRMAAEGAEHAGIVYASQERVVGEIIRGLMVIHEVLEADEMAGRVEYL